MVDRPLFGAILNQIYRAACDPAHWSAALAAVAKEITADAAAFIQFEPGRFARFLGVIGTESNFNDSYERYYIRINPWAASFARTPVGKAWFGHRSVPPAALKQTEFYNDWLRPQHYHETMGVMLQRQSSKLVFTTLRSDKRGFHTDSEAVILEQLAPHLQNAVTINQAFATAQALKVGLLNAWDHLSIGIVIVCADGRIVFASRVAEEIFRRSDGVGCVQGRIRGSTPEACKELDRAVGLAAETAAGRGEHPGGLVKLPTSGGRPIIALICPYRNEMNLGFTQQPAAMIFLRDPHAKVVLDERRIASLYGLTAAEARLFHALLEGKRLQDYAEESRISINTARGYLRQLFGKTGTHRQSDLLRLVLADPILRMSRR